MDKIIKDSQESDVSSILSNFSDMEVSESSVAIDESVEVMISAEQMTIDIEKTLEGMELFLQAKFDEADRLLRSQPGFSKSLYLNLGSSFVSFVKAGFTFDVEDIAQAESQMERTLMMAKKLKKSLAKPSLAMRLYCVLAGPKSDLIKDELTGQIMTPEQIDFIVAHATLIEAEWLVLLSVLKIFAEPDGTNISVLLKEVWNVRKSYIYYRGHEQNQQLSALEEDLITRKDDVEFRAGVNLGNGIINILFATMPPSIYKVFSYIGYTGDGKAGILQLSESAETPSIRSPLARILMLLYYTIVTGSFTSNRESGGVYGFDERADSVKRLLDPILEKYPESPIFLFFRGRSFFLQHKVRSAVEAYEKAIECSKGSWPSLRLAIYWDLVLGHMRSLEWDKCLEYSIVLARESRWSIVFCMYMEAIFRDAIARDSGDETVREPIEQILIDMPKFEKRIAGRAFPMERFAVTRAAMILEGTCRLMYAEYELMTLWDSYMYMTEDVLKRAETSIIEAIKEEELPWTSWASLTCSLASIRRNQGKLDGEGGSLTLLQSILDNRPASIPVCAVHILPLTHVEMAATLLRLGRPDEARPHYSLASKWKEKHYLDRTIQVRCSKLSHLFKKKQRKSSIRIKEHE